MSDARDRKRILIYSHDSFGLGHLRRCRTIAQILVAGAPSVSVLILSGSPMIGRFDFGERVDFVRVPGIIKLGNGDYTASGLDLDIGETVALRSSIIRHTASVFDPDLFIVDKEPLGLRGEVHDTLRDLRVAGCPLILGLRDVLDEPAALAREWARKGADHAVRDLYDQVWVYGLPQVYDPLAGQALPPSVGRKTSFTGYLRRGGPAEPADDGQDRSLHSGDGFLLVTPGGGGDGERLVDWVMRAYESGQPLPHRAIIVLGPFMAAAAQRDFRNRAGGLAGVDILTFDAHIEGLMARADGIVAMGGYNTFCEILSFDKPALLVPRTAPRREQLIRAERARDLGLAAMLDGRGARPAATMVTALRQLGQQPKPSSRVIPGLLDGASNLLRLARQSLGAAPAPLRATGGRAVR
jgi:predicted glycosyltransferase